MGVDRTLGQDSDGTNTEAAGPQGGSGVCEVTGKKLRRVE
jgi:hypothetical protein